MYLYYYISVVITHKFLTADIFCVKNNICAALRRKSTVIEMVTLAPAVTDKDSRSICYLVLLWSDRQFDTSPILFVISLFSFCLCVKKTILLELSNFGSFVSFSLLAPFLCVSFSHSFFLSFSFYLYFPFTPFFISFYLFLFLFFLSLLLPQTFEMGNNSLLRRLLDNG